MGQLGQLGDRDGGAQLAQRRQYRGGRDRVAQAPGEAELTGPLADRPVPALGVLFALVHVGDEAVTEGAAAVVADQRPLVVGLGVIEWVVRREDRAELLAEDALAGELGDERPEAAAQRPLRQRRAGGFQHHAAVEEDDPGEVDLQPAFEVTRHQLVGDRGAHVVGEDEDGPAAAVPADQLLGQVGLPEEAVVVVAGLRGEAEAEEVEGQHVAVRLLVEQQPPVVGAGGEAVEEQKQRSLAGLAEGVDPVATELDAFARPLPLRTRSVSAIARTPWSSPYRTSS